MTAVAPNPERRLTAPPSIDPEAVKSLLPTRGQMESMDTADLKKILDLSGYINEIVLNKAAEAWVILKARGFDLSDYVRHPKFKAVRDIAEGMIAAEAVVAFGPGSQLMRRVSRLPVEEQKRLAAGSPVEAVEIDLRSGEPKLDPQTGKPDFRLQPVDALLPEQLDLVLDHENGCVRSREQQAAVLAARKIARPNHARDERIRIHRGRISVQGEVPVEEMVAFLRRKKLID